MKDALARLAIPFVTLVATLILTACGGGHVSPTLSDNGIAQDAEIEQPQSEPVPEPVSEAMAVAAENKEVVELRRLAEQDAAEAQWILGAKYAEGLGVPQDDIEAVKWLHRAAEQGLAEVQFMVGGMYQRGDGVPQDDAEAVKWWRRAAEQGDAKAQYSLGGMYAKGLGVPQDNAEAMKWLRRAAEQGLAAAQFMVGFGYDTGDGVPQDHAEARKWYRLAAEQGHDGAQNALKGETWRCFAASDYNKTTALFTLTRVRSGSGEFGEVSVAGTTYSASFRIAGLNRRWNFGYDESRDGYPYAFVIKPDGTGLYYDFSTSSDGTASPRDLFECLMSP